MGSICFSLHPHGSIQRPPPLFPNIANFTTSLTSNLKPFLGELQHVSMKIDVSKAIKKASQRLLDAIVDSTFQFIDQPLLPSQSNFAPVDEIGEAVRVTSIEGEIPVDFPEGVYIRNGSNPAFGALQSAESAFGRSSNIWVEGEGMLHALYLSKKKSSPAAAAAAGWDVSYKNRFVRSETFQLETARQKPCFLPAIEGDSPAVLAAYLFNQLRFGKVNKYISNTNVFEHGGRVFSVAENHIPQEIDISTLETRSNWDIDGTWDRPFTSHPKRAPGSGELVIFGVDARKPFLVLGVVSADGKRLKHKVDLKLNRSTLCHDIGVSERYNIVVDMPLTMDINRLVKGGPLIKFEKESYARIGVLPRYGDADSVKWFEVGTFCIFHIVNCFENGDEVIVRGFRAPNSIIPGPEKGLNKYHWFSEGFKPMTEKECGENSVHGGFFCRLFEWRLNLKTGGVSGRYLTGFDSSMDFPMINDRFTGLYHKYGYAQVVDSVASSTCALPKYGSLAKLYLEEQVAGVTKVEYHQLGRNQFCSGATFVPKPGGLEEDEGWVISFVHDEDTDTSQVRIIDAQRFESEPIARITLPQRVSYGFHGTFIPKANWH